MKKINIILIILLSILWIPNTFAQARIEVTVQNATNGNNNGALTIQVIGTPGSFNYYVFDRNGVIVNSDLVSQKISKYSLIYV